MSKNRTRSQGPKGKYFFAYSEKMILNKMLGPFRCATFTVEDPNPNFFYQFEANKTNTDWASYGFLLIPSQHSNIIDIISPSNIEFGPRILNSSSDEISFLKNFRTPRDYQLMIEDYTFNIYRAPSHNGVQSLIVNKGFNFRDQDDISSLLSKNHIREYSVLEARTLRSEYYGVIASPMLRS